MTQVEKANLREQKNSVVLHFENGRLRLGECAGMDLRIQICLATVYSDEDMGRIEGSDMKIGYNVDQQVWVAVQKGENIFFEWGNWEKERKVAILFYVLAYEGEYLLFCNNEKLFYFSAVPQKDPRQNHERRIPNSHMTTNYHVLDELLRQTNNHFLKVLPY